MTLMSNSIYINIVESAGDWIIGNIAKDIQKEFVLKGISCSIGDHDNYNNEEICFHMSYAYAKPFKNARHNSIFITHIDDQLKEKLIKNSLDKFDSIICMSEDDAKYLVSLGFPNTKVFGPKLPVRSSTIRPIRMGIFSSYYKDGRKNEGWILDYYKLNKEISNIIFVFIGDHWGEFVKRLDDLDMSFEWHRTNRNISHEYEFQISKLDNLDYYFYLGFDGGAMGTYDAYSRGVNLLITSGSYHDEIPNADFKISSFNDFKEIIDQLLDNQKNKVDFFKSNSSMNYAKKLLSIWGGEESSIEIPLNPSEILEDRRSKYSSLSLRRFLSFIKQSLWMRFK